MNIKKVLTEVFTVAMAIFISRCDLRRWVFCLRRTLLREFACQSSCLLPPPGGEKGALTSQVALRF